ARLNGKAIARKSDHAGTGKAERGQEPAARDSLQFGRSPSIVPHRTSPSSTRLPQAGDQDIGPAFVTNKTRLKNPSGPRSAGAGLAAGFAITIRFIIDPRIEKADLGRGGPRRAGEAQVLVGAQGEHPATGGAADETLLQEIGLDDLLQGVAGLGERGGQRLDADRPAV